VFTAVLVEFLFRLTFGVATAMAVTPSRWVTSGFFRVHLWVLMGLMTLAVLASYSQQGSASDPLTVWLAVWRFWLAAIAAAASYIGAVIWMYERRLAGKLAIMVVAVCSLAGCYLPRFSLEKPISLLLLLADRVTSGLVLGCVTTAMLLGHWYLNTPTMKLDPLKRLIAMLFGVVGLRVIVSLAGAWLELAHSAAGGMPPGWTLFFALRWLSGIAGVLIVAWLAWQTLKIPNTQSATGILYAGVILAFIGELTSQLLSAGARYPV
jgi:hypothetical protein